MIRHTKKGFDFELMDSFLIMNDLRQQTRIMVCSTDPHAIIYSTHAISRYKERLGLDYDMDLVEVCKNMFLAGCIDPYVLVNTGEIYGTDIQCYKANFICVKGSFLGYISAKTQLCYAETFLSLNELREDQQYLDPNNTALYKKWKESWERRIIGKASRADFFKEGPYETPVAIDNGKLKILTQAEIEVQNEKCRKTIEDNPNFYEDQIEPNRQKAINRIKRKGYK